MGDDRRPAPSQEVSLADWLARTGHTQAWLGVRLGLSTAAMSRIARGLTMPRVLTAEHIIAVTAHEPPGVTYGGLVQAKAANSPNRAMRQRQAQRLIERASALLSDEVA